MKKCPPGVICIENITLFLIIICVLVVLFIIYNSLYKQNIIVNNKPSEKIVIKDTQRENNSWGGWLGGFIPSWPYTNDPLINPYAPPLRDERYFIPGFNGIPLGAVPINVSTNIGAVETNYRQLGILTPTNGKTKDNILPLMGRPLFTNRDKWNYYTTSNQHNNVKLPILRKGRSCTNEYGCDCLYTGDIVFIEGANETYRVKMYDNDTIRYLPFL